MTQQEQKQRTKKSDSNGYTGRYIHPHHQYAHGLPFDKKLAENLDDLIKRVEGNKAALIIIDGGVGEGKTTLSVEVGDYINKKKGRGNIDFETQLAMGGADFTKKVRICFTKKLPVVIYDEAGDFNRRGSLTRFNAMLNRTFETFRAFQVIVIISLPSFFVLDQDIFDKNIPRLLVHVFGRTQKNGRFKVWSLYRMLYIRKKMRELVVKAFAYNIVDCNFQGDFLDLETERSNKLDRLTIKGKMDVLQKQELSMDGLVGYQDIANKIRMSFAWVRMTLNMLHIKADRLIGPKKYFKEDVAEILLDYMDKDKEERRQLEERYKKKMEEEKA